MYDDRKLRIDAFVQQQDAPFVHAGDNADIVDAANSGRKIQATLTRVSGALDPRTRTMLVEVMLDNPKTRAVGRQLRLYDLACARAHRHADSRGRADHAGIDQFIAVVDRNSRLHFIKIAIASTDGDTITLAQGLNPGTEIAVDLPEDATDGALVQTVSAAAN